MGQANAPLCVTYEFHPQSTEYTFFVLQCSFLRLRAPLTLGRVQYIVLMHVSALI